MEIIYYTTEVQSSGNQKCELEECSINPHFLLRGQHMLHCFFFKSNDLISHHYENSNLSNYNYRLDSKCTIYGKKTELFLTLIDIS